MKKKLKHLLFLALIFSITLNSCKKDEEKEKDETALLTFENLQPEYMSFVNENEGWIYVTDNTNTHKLLHSTDGFQHYTTINSDMPNFIKITFINANVGFGDTYYDNNYFTLDGGVTWTAFNNPPLENYGWMSYNNNYFMTPIFDYNANVNHQYVGVAFYNLSDGSYSHKIEYPLTAVSTYHGSTGGNIHQSSVHVTDNGTVAFAGIDYDDTNFNTHIYTGFSTNTSDLNITEMSGSHSPERLAFPSDNVGYYTQKNDGKLFKTTNGGQTWSSIHDFSSSYYKELFFASETHGAVLVGDEIYFTNDGGQNFSKYDLNSGNYSGIITADYPVQNTAYIIIGEVDEGIVTYKLMKITP
jgi:hypothetical protein